MKQKKGSPPRGMRFVRKKIEEKKREKKKEKQIQIYKNRTKISRTFEASEQAAPSFYANRKFAEKISRPLRIERTLDPSQTAPIFPFFSSRLAIPLINEILYAFITFVVPLWIKPKSFEPVPRFTAEGDTSKLRKKKKRNKRKAIESP
ncbi:unnamed protein product [Xylocopa violacea]|uniref:Uncharacterized protein n=1 Tax=Xylocopa violacea TaxID=135666 RepID=A0ABP1PCS1_XYLVO